LDGPREAWPRAVRDRRRSRGRRQGSAAPWRHEASDHHAGRHPHCGLSTMAAKKKSEATAANKLADLRTKTPDELKDELVNLKKEQFNLRFQRATQQLEAPARVRVVRRDIARIKTILGEKAAAK